MSKNIKEVIENYIDLSVSKSKQSFLKLFWKAVFAGLFIGMGAAGSSVAAHSIDNVGLARLITGIVFPVGLMMVILLGAELFTGDCLSIMALPDHRISWKSFAKILLAVYMGNFAGAALLSLFLRYSGQFDYSAGLLGAYTIKLAAAKTGISFSSAVISGICCNVLVCAAVLMAGCAKDITGKLMVCFFVILLFVTGGYEHCVANMYYITAGILAKMNPSYVSLAVEKYGISQEMLQSLNFFSFLFKNLLPVTIGNIIGGAAVLGLPLFYINRSKEKEVIQLKSKEGKRHDNNDYNRSSGVAG